MYEVAAKVLIKYNYIVIFAYPNLPTFVEALLNGWMF